MDDQDASLSLLMAQARGQMSVVQVNLVRQSARAEARGSLAAPLRTRSVDRFVAGLCCLLFAAAIPAIARSDAQDDLTEALRITRQAEAQRIAVIDRAARCVVCVVDAQRRGGGSGVVIDEEGYGLTNFHVVANLLDTRRGFGGLCDGKLYPLEVLGIDVGGDVAMFRLTGRERFDASSLGDSDAVAVGDTAIAMGNPFVLAEDYTPTVTLGIVTGVHRYQWGEGNQLVYSDCIQVDTAINPGNSGGPLMSARGEVIGINGRISINARGRFNVGVGYAISANQIKRFMPGLRAGLLVEHGSLAATVDDVEGRGALFNRMYDGAPAWNAGIRPGDRLISFAGHEIHSRNHFASLLGTYPGGWTVEVVYERDGQRRTAITRLEPLSSGMDAPFEVDPRVNATAVTQVLRRFAEAAGVAPQRTQRTQRTGSSRNLWAARETVAAMDDGSAAEGEVGASGNGGRNRGDEGIASVTFEWRASESDAVLRRSGNGAGGPKEVTFNVSSAWWLDSEGKRFDLPPTEAMNYAALRVLLSLFDGSEVTNNGGGFVHRGADAWTGWAAPRNGAEPPILHVLHRDVAGHALARFAFDVDEGFLRRVVVTDQPSGAQTVFDLLDYADRGPARFPRSVVVSSADAVVRYDTVELIMVETE
ncbi:MAG: PDZ domain-containing protein [Phycisphaerales bacterium]|nr:MAG: PDZ domain-containing protein [Phycisphaerales bacterium]